MAIMMVLAASRRMPSLVDWRHGVIGASAVVHGRDADANTPIHCEARLPTCVSGTWTTPRKRSPTVSSFRRGAGAQGGDRGAAAATARFVWHQAQEGRHIAGGGVCQHAVKSDKTEGTKLLDHVVPLEGGYRVSKRCECHFWSLSRSRLRFLGLLPPLRRAIMTVCSLLYPRPPST